MKPSELKRIRESKGIQQKDMAVELDIAYQTYRAYEGGCFKKMSPEKERKISEILGVDYFYERK